MATTTGELGDTIPTIIEEAQFTQQFKAIMRPLVWNIPKGKGSNVNIPYFGGATSRQLTEGVDMVNDEKMVDTNVQITPYEAGLKIILTDNVIEDDNEALIRAAGVLLGDAYEKKRDTDLTERMDSAASSLASSANALTMGDIAACRATLLGTVSASGGPAPTPYVCVIHPFHELDLVDVLTPLTPFGFITTAGTALAAMQAPGLSMAEDALRNYSIGRLFGMPVLTDGNIALTAVSAKGGVFAAGQRGGIVYVSAREPTIKPTRDESLRGWELVYAGRYGVGNFHTAWTVELWADATAPA